MDRSFAKNFAAEWVAAWNSRDLDRVLKHYSDDFEMASPYIVSIMGEPSGVLKGKTAVAAYWTKALALLPQLKFELLNLFVGANSLVIRYRNDRNVEVAEALFFNANGMVNKAAAHYDE
ncbi:MAG TPA: nuclear transport factor 2 family protein [Rhodocyclaceae bacterium]|nr:nuclear transport factor 2 family protein [Rhodocyclaceae bacterium]